MAKQIIVRATVVLLFNLACWLFAPKEALAEEPEAPGATLRAAAEAARPECARLDETLSDQREALAELETEKQRLETEKQRLETEKQRLETEKQRLETEKDKPLSRREKTRLKSDREAYEADREKVEVDRKTYEADKKDYKNKGQAILTRIDLLVLAKTVCALGLDDPFLANVAAVTAPREAAEAEQVLKAIAAPAQSRAAGLPSTEIVSALVGLGSGAGEFFTEFGKTLAEFILRRAQQEAVAWTLERMAEDLCSDVGEPWFPHLCALAKDVDLGFYAAGDAMLEAMQGALKQDARGWPGEMLDRELGTSGFGKSAMERIARGANPALALHDLGEDWSAASPSPLAAAEACSLAAPAVQEMLRRELSKTNRSHEGALLGSLVATPACWNLLKNPASNERFAKLKVLAAIDPTLRDRLSAGRVPGAALAKAIERYEAAAGSSKAPSPAGAAAKKAGETGADDGTDKDDDNNDNDNDNDDDNDEMQQASLGVFDASLELARTTAVMLSALGEVEADEVSAQLDRLGRVSDLLAAITGERWGEAVAIVIRHVKANSDESSCKDESKDKCTRERFFARLGMVASMLSASDDKVALGGLLRAAAYPPGGWRSKQRPGVLTVSLAAFPGLYAAAEWRWGPYGAVVEGGRPAYAQTPTFTMPLGVDLAWGFEHGKRSSTFGLFFPLIDPAGFLGYDADEGGKLPAPRPTTVLSPGVGVRFSFPNTPFGLLLCALYRPQYRTWKPTISGPGAEVLQLGGALVIDATLWSFRSRSRRKK